MLTPVEKRKLRQSAHRLKPVVLVGQHGLSAPVVAEIERALGDHELVKVRFRGLARAARARGIERVTHELGAELVDTIGGVAVLYRQKPERRPQRSTS